MKAYFYREKVREIYYLGVCNLLLSFKHEKLSIDDSSYHTGEIISKHESLGNELFFEIDYSAKEYSPGDKIRIEGKEYTIKDKSFNPDGSVNYYVNDKIIEVDEESKKEAEKDYKGRLRCLLNRSMDENKKLNQENEELKEENKKLKHKRKRDLLAAIVTVVALTITFVFYVFAT